MESVSSDQDIRAITLRYESEGCGRFLVLSNGKDGGEMYFDHPDDIGALYQAAQELWSQGDIAVRGEALENCKLTEMIDSAKAAFGDNNK